MLSLTQSYSQRVIDFEILFDEPYPRTIGELLDNSRFDVIILNDVPRDIDLYFKSEIKVSGANEYTISTINERMAEPVLTLSANESTSFRDGTINLSDLGYTINNIQGLPPRFTSLGALADFQNTYLDEGMYTICVTAFDYQTDTQLSAKVCNFNAFTIEKANLRVDWFEQSFECGDVTDMINLGWHVDAMTDADDCFEYEVVIARLEEGMNPLDALTDPNMRIPPSIDPQSDMIVSEPFFNNSDGFLTEDMFPEGEYVFQINAIENPIVDCTVLLDQDSSSPIHRINVSCSEEGDDESEALTNYDCNNCDDAEPDDLEVASLTSLPETFYAGYYAIEKLEANSSGNNSFSGSGKTKIGLFGFDDIPVKVEFEDIRLNSDGQLVEGTIKTVLNDAEDLEVNIDPDAELSLADIKNNNEEQYNNLVAGLNTLNQLMASGSSLGSGEGLLFPLGVDQEYNGKEYKVVIEELVFELGGAKLLGTFNWPINFSGQEKYISFSISNLCITPDGTFGPGIVQMYEPMVVFSESDGYTVKINGCQDCDNESSLTNGSYLNFDCDGVIGGRLECSVDFPNAGSGSDIYLTPFSDAYADNQEIPNQVNATFSFQLQEEGEEDNGWLFSIEQFTPFEINRMKGWGFEIQEGTLDLSEEFNPNGLVFPNGHFDYGPKPDFANETWIPLSEEEEELSSLWTGIHLGKVAVYLPPQLRGIDLESFSITNGVFDLGGNFNCSMSIQSDKPFGNSKKMLGNWGNIIDNINIQFVNNEITQGGIVGDFFAPFLKGDDNFRYQAIISHDIFYNELNYSFIVNPFGNENSEEKVTIPIFLAEARLAQSSHITMAYSESKGHEFKAHLSGDLGISPETVNFLSGDLEEKLSSVPLDLVGIPFALKYETDKGFEGSHLALNLNLAEMVNAEVDKIETAINNDMASLENGISELDNSLNSIGNPTSNPTAEVSKKELAGFELSFHYAEISGTPDAPRLYLELRMHIMAGDEDNEDADKNGFGLDARIFFEGRYNNADKKYELADFGLESIGVDVQTSNIKLRGSVTYKNTATEKSFEGALAVDIEGLGLGLSMAGAFGTAYKNGNKDFNFWYARLVAKIDDGIKVGATGVAFYGLGGGVFYNYRMTENYRDNFGRGSFASLTQDPSDLEGSLYNTSGLEKAEDNFGLSLFALIAPVGDPNPLNVDVTLSLQVGKETSIEIEGNAFMMTEEIWKQNSTLEKECMVYGFLRGSFTFEDAETGNSEFLLSTGMSIQVPAPGVSNQRRPILTGNVTAELLASPSDFHIYIGVPDGYDYKEMSPGRIDARFGGVGARVQFYAMLGDGIPTNVSLPDSIMILFDETSAVNSQGSNGDDVAGSGGVEGSVTGVSGESRPDTYGSGIAFGSMIKSEMNFTFGGDDFKTGVDGFALAGFDINLSKSENRSCAGYANPGINDWYALGQIYAGLRVSGYLLGKEFASIKAVAVVQGGLPNPTWIFGRARLSYRVYLPPVVAGVATVGLEAVESISDAAGGNFENDTEWLWDAEANEDAGVLGGIWNATGNRLVKYAGPAILTGGFDFEIEIGDKCLPTIDYENSEELPFPIIKSITPSDGADEVDFLSQDITLELFVKEGKFVDVPMVKNGELVYEQMKVKLDRFKVKAVNGGGVAESDYYMSGTTETLEGVELEPNKEYEIIVELNIEYNDEIFKTVSRETTFETGPIPDKFEDSYVLTSSPGRYELFFHLEDRSTGYITLNSKIYDLIFKTESSGTSSNFNTSNNFGFSLPSSFFGNNNTIESVNTGPNISGVSNNPLSGIDLPDLSSNTPNNSSSGSLASNQTFFIRITPEDGGPIIEEAIIRDNSRHRLKFDLGQLELSKVYKLSLMASQDIGATEMWSYRFRTSQYGSIMDKLNDTYVNGGRKKSKGFNNSFSFFSDNTDKYIQLKEPFDSYTPIINLNLGFKNNPNSLISRTYNHYVDGLNYKPDGTEVGGIVNPNAQDDADDAKTRYLHFNSYRSYYLHWNIPRFGGLDNSDPWNTDQATRDVQELGPGSESGMGEFGNHFITLPTYDLKLKLQGLNNGVLSSFDISNRIDNTESNFDNFISGIPVTSSYSKINVTSYYNNVSSSIINLQNYFSDWLSPVGPYNDDYQFRFNVTIKLFNPIETHFGNYDKTHNIQDGLYIISNYDTSYFMENLSYQFQVPYFKSGITPFKSL